MEQLLQKILAGDPRSIAKAISLAERRDPVRFGLLAGLRPFAANVQVLGVTGPPGAGKSTLVDRLTTLYRREGLQVGIIAVDPSSPITGGALLGDRIRMQGHSTDAGVFIRSMGTRGSLGGLAQATDEAVQILAAGGKDRVIVETVGVGQSETDIVKTADTTVLVLTPDAGDSIQTIKAGVLEIADIYVVNKADLPGAMRLARSLRAMLENDARPALFKPPVLTASMVDDRGAVELQTAIAQHRQFLEQGGELEKRRNRRVEERVIESVADLLKEWLIKGLEEDPALRREVRIMGTTAVDPGQSAAVLVQKLLSVNEKNQKMHNGGV